MVTEMSRRSALKTAGGAALSALFLSAFNQPAKAVAGTGLGPADFALLRTRWIDQITGRQVIVPGDPDFTKALGTLDKKTGTIIGLLTVGTARVRVFNDLDLAKDADLVMTHTRLATMATSWATPGSIYFRDQTLLASIRSGLSDAHDLAYNDTREEQGNWWSWEIGTPKALADTMVLLHEELTSTEIAAYCAAIDHFVPDPWQQFPPKRGKITSVGANRVDLCQAIVIRSLVDDNADKLTHAVAGLSDVWQYVSSGNGFFKDGSFIQHSTTPYTGSYGVVLLTGLSKLFALLGQSPAALSDPTKDILFKTVENSFAPFMMAGAMADAVRGRSISRDTNTGFDLGASTIESILLLARAVVPGVADRWRGLCQGWIAENQYAPILSDASVSRTALVKELLASGIPPIDLPEGHYLFPAMDRTVHRSNGWTLSTSMCSNRIAWYECGNGENNRGYHTGSGMTYVYDSDNSQYDDAYWATVNYSRLPGITADKTPLPDKVEGEWGAATPKNEWTGSAVLDDVAAVGQHLIGPGGTGLTARKAWFVSKEVIVCLGADIRSSSAEPVETILEHRNLHNGSNVLKTAQGTAADITGREETIAGSAWAHLEGVGGYIVLDGAEMRAVRERRQGAWSQVNIKGSPAMKARNFMTLYVDHGTAPAGASYAYMLAPGAPANKTEILSRQPFHEVVRNDAVAQGVRFKKEKTIAATFWKPGTIGDLTLSGPACILFNEVGDTVKLGLSEPTQSSNSLTINLRRNRQYRIVDGSGASLSREADGSTIITVDTTGLSGATKHVTLQAV